MSLLTILYNYNSACESNKHHGGAAMCLFQYFTVELFKVALARRAYATEEDDH